MLIEIVWVSCLGYIIKNKYNNIKIQIIKNPNKIQIIKNKNLNKY